MQPESCHHAQDPFAQGLGPYREIPAWTQNSADTSVCQLPGMNARLIWREKMEIPHHMKKLLIGIMFLLFATIAFAQDHHSRRQQPTPQQPTTGWYWGVQSPSNGPESPNTGPELWVGPYSSDSDCADMYGSAIYAHPWECHLTGQDCGIIGNGFAYPESYPYPVPADEVIAGNLNCQEMTIANNPYTVADGWYFLYYPLSGAQLIGSTSLKTCTELYAQYASLALTTPGAQIGYYSDSKCPGAPCFSVGTDTACE